MSLRSVQVIVEVFKDNTLKIQVNTDSLPDTLRDMSGIETVIEVEAESFKHDGVFYTDSSGLRMVKRKKDRVNKWIDPESRIGFNITENYFPMTSAVSIHDNSTNRQMVIYTDRP